MRRALQLIIYAVRPVTLEEVAEAVVTEVGQDSLDIESRLHHPGLLLAICGSLVSFNDGELGLAHYSVQEYLTSERIQHGPAREFAMTETKSAFEISAICLTYLGFTDFNIGPCPPADIKFRQHSFPFLTYAALNWFVHAKVQSVELRIISLATKIFNNDLNQNLHSWSQVYWMANRDFMPRDIPYLDSPLAYPIRLRLPELARYILQTGAHVPCAQGLRRTIIYDDANMLEALLQHGADPNAECDGQTHVCHAARLGRERMLKLLFQYGADIGSGALLLAVQSLHFGAVQVLLQNGADCNEVSDLGSTALYFAVRESDLMMVYLLLEHGADPSPIPGYRTPSCSVKKIWFDSIVEILRQSRASITTLTERSNQALDDDTITRLDRIVEMLSSIVLVGHEPMYFKQDHSWGMIVEMLLWYGWDRDSPNKNSSDQPRYPVARFEVPGSWTRIAETLRVFPKIAFTPTTHQRVTQTPGDARLQDKWGDELDN